MNVSLSPDVQRYLDGLVSSGRYRSIDDAVNDLISVVRSEEELSERDVEELRAEIDEGLRDVDAGRVAEWDLDDLKPRVRERLESEKRAG
jgi:antitoxin ParD1/3/4